MHSGVVFPVGSKPDGASWTGFVVEASDGDGGYALLFRDGAAKGGWTFDLEGYLRSGKSCETLAGDGTASLDGTLLSASVPSRLGYVWVKIRGK